jgi:hypothetical protein
MFGPVCKGLHCACCKTWGAGPLLILGILYVISALNKSAIVSLLLHGAEVLAIIGVGAGFIFGACYAFLTWITKGHISSYEWEGYEEVRNARASAYQATVVRLAPPAITNHSNVPLLYRTPIEERAEGQRIILERRDER